MADYLIRPAREADVAAVAPHLRPADRDEVYAASGRSGDVALLSALRRSTQAWTGEADGVPIVMWGVGPLSLLNRIGCPWLLGTLDLERHPREFLRQSPACLREMLRTYHDLQNFVDERNRLSIRWLRWLGFTIAPAEPYGFLGLPFHRFSMRLADV